MVSVPVDLSKLSDAVKSNFAKKTDNDELVKKVSNIKTTDTSDLVRKADYNTKISNIEKKILDHNHDKYITTQEFNELTLENSAAKLAQAKIATKDDIANFSKKANFNEKLININRKVTLNKTRHVEVQNKLYDLLKKVKIISIKGLTKDLRNKYSILSGAKHFLQKISCKII